MSFYVYSTMTSSTAYAVYKETNAKDIPVITKKILIEGGSNVVPIPSKGIITPRGVVTEVSDDDMALLEKDYHFNEHKKHGYITVEKKAIPVEKAVAAMEPKDAYEEKKAEDGIKIYKDKESKRK